MKTKSRRLLLTALAFVFAVSAVSGVLDSEARDARGSDSTKSAPVALITGSDRGIGFALVQELESRGWRVLATCRDPEHAEALRTFATAHSHVTVDALDVSDNSAIEALSARYRNQPIDALINNAA